MAIEVLKSVGVRIVDTVFCVSFCRSTEVTELLNSQYISRDEGLKSQAGALTCLNRHVVRSHANGPILRAEGLGVGVGRVGLTNQAQYT